MLETPEKVRELQRKLYRKAKQDCESLWKKMIGKSRLSGRKLDVRFEVAGDGEVLWRTYTGTKLETADTAKGIPNVTRHSLTLPQPMFL
jgi:hypothetical protein